MDVRWKSWGTRQLTGTGFAYHGYVGRERIELMCCNRNHRKEQAAADCAKRAARRLNRTELEEK